MGPELMLQSTQSRLHAPLAGTQAMISFPTALTGAFLFSGPGLTLQEAGARRSLAESLLLWSPQAGQEQIWAQGCRVCANRDLETGERRGDRMLRSWAVAEGAWNEGLREGQSDGAKWWLLGGLPSCTANAGPSFLAGRQRTPGPSACLALHSEPLPGSVSQLGPPTEAVSQGSGCRDRVGRSPKGRQRTASQALQTCTDSAVPQWGGKSLMEPHQGTRWLPTEPWQCRG